MMKVFCTPWRKSGYGIENALVELLRVSEELCKGSSSRCEAYILSPWISPLSIEVYDKLRREPVEMSLELYLALLSTYVEKLYVCQRNPEVEQGRELRHLKNVVTILNRVMKKYPTIQNDLRSIVLELVRDVKRREDRFYRELSVTKFIKGLRRAELRFCSNLHAKVYAIICDSKDSKYRGIVCIGSANLTYAGMITNVEVLICINLDGLSDHAETLVRAVRDLYSVCQGEILEARSAEADGKSLESPSR